MCHDSLVPEVWKGERTNGMHRGRAGEDENYFWPVEDQGGIICLLPMSGRRLVSAYDRYLVDVCNISFVNLCFFQVPFYDVVDVKDIKDVVCLRRLPEKAIREMGLMGTGGAFFVNRFAK